MANEGKDLRDNTRAMNNLAKAILTLNDTMVSIERYRQSDSLIKMCPMCAQGECSPGTMVLVRLSEYLGCACCKASHERENLQSSGSGS